MRDITRKRDMLRWDNWAFYTTINIIITSINLITARDIARGGVQTWGDSAFYNNQFEVYAEDTYVGWPGNTTINSRRRDDRILF